MHRRSQFASAYDRAHTGCIHCSIKWLWFEELNQNNNTFHHLVTVVSLNFSFSSYSSAFCFFFFFLHLSSFFFTLVLSFAPSASSFFFYSFPFAHSSSSSSIAKRRIYTTRNSTSSAV